MPTTSKDYLDRALMPDLVRAFALVGIAVVNVIGFSQPIYSGFFENGLAQLQDQAAFALIAGLFLMKAYPLFSMMFGAGLAWQMKAAERSGANADARFFRRMAALIVLGTAHFIFFWIGDILITYGLLGCILYMMRDLQARSLVKAGIILIVINVLLLLAMTGLIALVENYSTDTSMQDELLEAEAAQVAAFTTGTFWEAAVYRLSLMSVMLPSLQIQQGLGVLGFFCFGLAAAKSGTIENPQAKIWKISRRIFLPIGLLGSAAGAWLVLDAGSMTNSKFLFASSVLMLFSPFSALGYAGLIAKLSISPPGKIRQFLAKAGSASLTAYLLQSLLFSLIFTAYGFGLFGELSAFAALGVSLAVAFASLLFVGIWRSFHPRGPMEILLRRFTYWGRG